MEFVSTYLSGQPLITSKAWFYARKVNVAATADWARYIEKVGVNTWLDQQLNPEYLAEPSAYETERKALFPSMFIDAPGNKTRDRHFWDTFQPGAKNHPYDVSVYVLEAALHRLWRSNKQLQGTMALFWADMLAATIEKAPDGYHDYVCLLFEGALGKYKDLLWCITTSQTMALFLDNNTNTRFALNENMGRELMELHGWGPEKGYTEQDVVNVSKLLTGLRGNTNEEFAEARPDLHYFGPLTVAGRTFRNGGSTPTAMYRTARELTDYIAGDRLTGLRIARRLIQYFVGRDQSYEELAQKLATVYVNNDTDVRPMLKQLLTSPEFLASGGKTVRRPWTVLCSIMAAGNVKMRGWHNLSDTSTIAAPLYRMYLTLKYNTGGVPFDAPATNGYSLDAHDWINSVSYAAPSQFNRYANYVDTWDGNAADSFSRWAEPIVWSKRVGITLGSTSIVDAAGKIFRYLTGYEPNNAEIINAIAAYATVRDEATVMTARPAQGAVRNEEQVRRMVDATLTCPHFLIS
ncbi:DUF1800 family protein [Rothia sp. LK2588]|uniref:DUF1800 family protein n=1 Tax=Rothia sp. LK2588 TaxID=3114369 RepID=UPI0034CE07DC